MRYNKLVRVALTAAIAAALPQMVWAEGAAAPDPQTNAANPDTSTATNKEQAAAQSNTQSLEGIVVTGSATGVKKIDASYTVTAANLEQIREANPKSTADMLKISPGIWPESSGGQTGANIEIAGFPGGGDAPFFTEHGEGSPLYGMSVVVVLGFDFACCASTTPSSASKSCRAVPACCSARARSGATANFILQQGSAEPSGSIGLTYGDEGLYRVDGFYGFKIADGWYGSVGGFWREVRRRARSAVQVRQRRPVDGNADARLRQRLVHAVCAASSTTRTSSSCRCRSSQTAQRQFLEATPASIRLTDSYGSKAIQHVTICRIPPAVRENANLADGRGAEV